MDYARELELTLNTQGIPAIIDLKDKLIGSDKINSELKKSIEEYMRVLKANMLINSGLLKESEKARLIETMCGDLISELKNPEQKISDVKQNQSQRVSKDKILDFPFEKPFEFAATSRSV